MIKPFIAMLLFILTVVSILWLNHKQSIDAINHAQQNHKFCGTLIKITTSKLKSGVSIEYYYLQNLTNIRSFKLLYNVSPQQRDRLKLNESFCFNYCKDMFGQSVVVSIT